jgi:hypothetical protein
MCKNWEKLDNTKHNNNVPSKKNWENCGNNTLNKTKNMAKECLEQSEETNGKQALPTMITTAERHEPHSIH